jgi:hypothetical protein
MDEFPLPIIAIWGDILNQELLGLSHCLSHVIFAVLISLVFSKSTFANAIESFIFGIFYKAMYHSLNIINERIVANERKSQGIIFDLFIHESLIEEELPCGKNGCSNRNFVHASIPCS